KFFFFTSRRRHTRFSRDWSSDVCSSDLKGGSFCMRIVGTPGDRMHWHSGILHRNSEVLGPLELRFANVQSKDVKIPQRSYFLIRSEERRVGKECRCRYMPDL